MNRKPLQYNSRVNFHLLDWSWTWFPLVRVGQADILAGFWWLNSCESRNKLKVSKEMRRAKTTVLLVAATGLTFHAFNSDFLSSSSADFLPSFPEHLRTPIHGVVRSSRAISTVCFLPPSNSPVYLSINCILLVICFRKLQIALTAVDYKLTLRGIPADSDEYRQKLSQVGMLICFSFHMNV